MPKGWIHFALGFLGLLCFLGFAATGHGEAIAGGIVAVLANGQMRRYFKIAHPGADPDRWTP